MAIDTDTLTLRPRRGRGWLAILVVLLLAAAGFGYYRYILQVPARTADQVPTGRPGGGRFGPGAQGGLGGRPTPVAVARAVATNVPVYLNGLGSVTPVASVTVRTRIDGQLLRVHFREGQSVNAGDLLAEIDPRQYQVQLAQAQGQMQKDEALLANARLDLERYRTLFAQDSGSKQQLDTQTALVRQLEGAVKIDQSQIDNARLQLDHCRIVAPISGRLGLRQIDPGNIVRAADPAGLVVVTQLSPIGVVFSLPEDNVQQVMDRVRQGARIAVDAYDRAGKEKLAAGSLLALDNQIDPSTGSVKLKAQFDNRDGRLFPSQFVNVRMLIDTLKDATVIPAQAVQRGTRGTFVYVVKSDRTVTIRQVRLGQTQGQNVAVEQGVATGEIVVIDGAERLREGASVELPADVPPAARRPGANRSGGGKAGAGKSGARQGPNAGSGGGAAPGGAASAGAGAGGGAALFAQLFTQAERDAFRERVQSASPEDRLKIRAEIRALLEKRAKEKGIALPPPGQRGAGGNAAN